MEMKKCSKCGEEKPLNEFHNNKASKDGKVYQCKTCIIERSKKHYMENREQKLEYQKEYSDKNKEEMKIKDKKRHKIYNEKNKEKIKINNKEYKNNNKEKISKQNKKYREDNKEFIKNSKKIYKQKQFENNPTYKLKHNISNLIRYAFKDKNFSKKSKTTDILGCTKEFFKEYIESKFEPWMNWDNYGKFKNCELNYGWDIDHIEPISNAKTEEDIIRLNHYTNLQPLCSYTNRYIKRDKF